MLNRHNRLLVTFHVLSDALLAVTAFILAYALRFHSVIIPLLIPITKGVPPLRQYIQDLPFIAILVPLEAQACGRPVVALGRGGALETVVPGVTGTLVNDLDAPAFSEALTDTIGRRFEVPAIRAHAERFSRARFADEMSALIREACHADAPAGSGGA